jgi:ribose/xylose/arabinose/galactoside ABC-type transport system permease subunit
MKLRIDRKFMPLLVTILVLIVGYAFGYSQYKGMRQPQAFFNIFIDNAFLLITSVGMTFVILSGGIDLSVGAVIALTTVASAHLLEMEGWSPGAVIPLMLLMGTALGAAMGSIIHFFQVQPFIVTLAGMFIARGTCFFISLTGVTISDPFYRQVALYQIPIPLFEKAFISINVVIALAVLVIAVYLAHFTRFGRTVYAIGGSEESALLMGLPVGRTKVLIYTLNGFLSALAGIVYSIYLLSGFGLNALNLEMDAIASVVIGGTLLDGGVGYVFGTMFGVLINGLIQNLIMFNGQLLSWWTRIAIGALTLVSLGLQSAFAATRRRRVVVEKQARSNNKSTASGQK